MSDYCNNRANIKPKTIKKKIGKKEVRRDYEPKI
jgi:hypothetical protein